MKSRPPWAVLEAHQFEAGRATILDLPHSERQVFGKDRGFGICDPAVVAPSSVALAELLRGV